MTARLTSVLVAVMALSSGCIIVDGSGGYGGGGGYTQQPIAGNATFTWSFGGRGCAELPDVASVRITIPGQTLQNQGVYACSTNGYPGIVLHDFAPGTYDVTLEAFSRGGALLYGVSSSFTVNGDVRVTLDLTPAGGPNSFAYVGWSFPASGSSQSPTCAQAGVSAVYLSIDGAQPTAFDCAAGQSGAGVQTPYVSAGNHTIDLQAATSSGYVLYATRATLTTYAGSPIASGYALSWAVGGTAVRWSLTNGQLAQTCGQAGVSQVSVNFIDAQGNLVYGSTGDLQDCNTSGVIYSYLRPGTYRVAIGARGAGGTVYQSSSAGPMISVQAGVFVDGSSAVNVQLFRTQ